MMETAILHQRIDAITKQLMGTSMQEKRDLPYSERDSFIGSAVVVESIDETGDSFAALAVPLMWKNNRDKRQKMDILSAVCRNVDAKALIVITDSRVLKFAEFAKHFDVPEETQWNPKLFQTEYERIMSAFDYNMENLPPDLWEETLIAACYGPRVKRITSAKYQYVNEVIQFEPLEVVSSEEGGDLRFNLIPAWWT